MDGFKVVRLDGETYRSRTAAVPPELPDAAPELPVEPENPSSPASTSIAFCPALCEPKKLESACVSSFLAPSDRVKGEVPPVWFGMVISPFR